MPDRKFVFLVHGRNRVARQGLLDLLERLGLSVMTWSDARSMVTALNGGAVGSPTVLQIVQAGMDSCQAILVLLTPDESTQLRDEFYQVGVDSPAERQATGQARPNVIFEAGLALGLYPDRTILLDLGNGRVFSDLAGVHRLMVNSGDFREDLKSALEAIKCDVVPRHGYWEAGRFEPTLRQRFELWVERNYRYEHLLTTEQLGSASSRPGDELDSEVLAFCLVSSIQHGPAGNAREWIYRNRGNRHAAVAMLDVILFGPHRRPKLRAAKVLECLGSDLMSQAIAERDHDPDWNSDPLAAELIYAAQQGKTVDVVEGTPTSVEGLRPHERSELLGEFLSYPHTEHRHFGV